jgi:hypothetical protein
MAVEPNEPDSDILDGERLDNCGGAVARAIVYNQHLKRLQCLTNGTLNGAADD